MKAPILRLCKKQTNYSTLHLCKRRSAATGGAEKQQQGGARERELTEGDVQLDLDCSSDDGSAKVTCVKVMCCAAVGWRLRQRGGYPRADRTWALERKRRNKAFKKNSELRNRIPPK